MKTIVITGAECSGKTTLAKDLADHFKTDYCIEEARPFLQKLNRKHTYSDVEELAKKQEEIQFKFINSQNNFALLDTDLLTIKIWLEDKFNQCPNWIDEKIQKLVTSRIYLLSSPSIPYEPDPLREDENRRAEIFEIYKTELEKLGAKYFIIEGDKTERLKKSIDLIGD
jgi:nicotinamide riboside kinase